MANSRTFSKRCRKKILRPIINLHLDPWGFYDSKLVTEFCALAGPREDEEHARYSLATLSVGQSAV